MRAIISASSLPPQAPLRLCSGSERVHSRYFRAASLRFVGNAHYKLQLVIRQWRADGVVRAVQNAMLINDHGVVIDVLNLLNRRG